MKQKLIKTKNAYICLSLITLAAATLALLISNGSLFQVFFFMDPDDTGMDFFNSIVETATRRPYEQYGVLYPPLANLFFYLLALFIPNDIKAGWPESTHVPARIFLHSALSFLPEPSLPSNEGM